MKLYLYIYFYICRLDIVCCFCKEVRQNEFVWSGLLHERDKRLPLSFLSNTPNNPRSKCKRERERKEKRIKINPFLVFTKCRRFPRTRKSSLEMMFLSEIFIPIQLKLWGHQVKHENRHISLFTGIHSLRAEKLPYWRGEGENLSNFMKIIPWK